MKDKRSVFGYGSLIMPTSLIQRFDEELREQAKKILEERDEDTQDELTELNTSKEALRKLEESSIDFIPAKIYGYRRYYSLEWSESGNQLSVRKTGDEKDFVNGVIATNLSEEQFKKVERSEEPYNSVDVKRKNYDTYPSKTKLDNRGIELPDKATLFVGDMSHPAINPSTDRARNPGYHRAILKGIDVLSDLWYDSDPEREEFTREFKNDFLQTTYEMTDDGWKTLAEIEDEN
ncbi:MAG: hypothetical protein ABEI58_03965 [Candidatus Nanohaloarchaea archaeon]